MYMHICLFTSCRVYGKTFWMSHLLSSCMSMVKQREADSRPGNEAVQLLLSSRLKECGRGPACGYIVS